MRGKDLRDFMIIARRHKLIILVRQTSDDALRYVGQAGYYPKPAIIKAKTASRNPPATKEFVNGRVVNRTYELSGLVIHPGFQPNGHEGVKQRKAGEFWEKTMKVLSPTLTHTEVDRTRSDTWSIWGVERTAVSASRWKWRVDIDPESKHFGCLQLKGDNAGWCYIHGDYDLKDVIVLGKEKENYLNKGTVDGVPNFTPNLSGVSFESVQRELNSVVGADMVQHGAEAQFAWHGDEPITVIYPDWTHLTLMDASTVQSWYEKLNREVLAEKGHDYLADRSRMFLFGPDGIFAPGMDPGKSWG